MPRSTLVLLVSLAAATAAYPSPASEPVSVTLEDIESGSPDPQGPYRWMDAADQLYDVDDSDGYSYRQAYDYTQAFVQVDFFTGADTLHGQLTGVNLKPHFAYQFKLVGVPGTQANEHIGLTGRWWQEEWNGAAWVSGHNLNDKGDGSSPNPNDLLYFARRDAVDPTSPTGLRYRFTGYLVFEYFITNAYGDAAVAFEATSSYHVLWKTSQRARTELDGPERTSTFDVELPDPVSAYDTDYPQATATVFGEWERLPVGGVYLPPGGYQAEFVLTEESFHGGGLAGGWAGAMAATVAFELAITPGDIDGDRDVDLIDFAMFANCYGLSAAGTNCTSDVLSASDMDGDGAVTLNDFATFAVNFTG
jgi:hypothetical protein